MPDNFDDRADELLDSLRQMIEPADRFGERLVALAADMRTFPAPPPIAPPAPIGPGIMQLAQSPGETATRNGQREQLKLIGEQLAEQKRTNEHLQTMAERDSQDVLGP